MAEMGRDSSSSGFRSRCASCYACCSSLVTRLLEAFFAKFGTSVVGTYPWSTLLLSVLICAICSSGFSQFYQSTDDEFLWTPYGSPYVDQKAWIMNNFPKDKRYETIILSGGNVLSATHIQYMYNIYEQVQNVTSSTGETFEDLCVRDRPVGGNCIVSSILQVWHYNKSVIWNLSNEQILSDVGKALADSTMAPSLQPLISNVSWHQGDGQVDGASALMSVWIIKENGTRSKGGDYVDPVADRWEAALIDLLVDQDNLDRNGRKIKGKPDNSNLDVVVESSFIDGMDAMVKSNSITLYAGGVLLLAFTCTVLGKFNALEQRIVLSLCGLLVIGLALGASFGLCFYMGLFYADMHPMIPFLMLGIGVDDMFVIVKALDNLSVFDKGKPVATRIGLAMKHAGVSITVTSMTNMSSFLIGGTSRMPIVRSFCIFCAMGLLFLYFFSITFFVACLTLDERRMDKRKPIDCPCIQPKPVHWVPNTFSQIEFGSYIFGTTIPKIIFTIPMKIIVLTLTMGVFGTAVYGVTQLETNYNPILYMDKTSYQVRFYNSQEEYFPDDGERIEVYVGDIDYYKFPDQLLAIQTSLAALPSVRNESVQFWFTKFHDFCQVHGPCDNEKMFMSQLVEFFISDPNNLRYLNDIKFDGNASCLEPDYDGPCRIKASRATFQHYYLANTRVQNEALESVKDALKGITFAGQSFTTPIAYSFTYVQWTANELMSSELVRNLSLNFGTVTVLTILFLPNLQMVLLCLCCVAFTVANVAGFSYFLGLTIEIITVINLILSVGLAIDYCAHIAVTYTCNSKNETRQTKARKALGDVGAAVFNGGLSTFLAFFMVAFSDSYVFTTFFKMFALVALFGLFHGLIFLPVALSLIGPQGENPKDEPDDDSDNEDNLVGHINWSFTNNPDPQIYQQHSGGKIPMTTL